MSLKLFRFYSFLALVFGLTIALKAQSFTKEQLEAAAKVQGIAPSQVEQALNQLPIQTNSPKNSTKTLPQQTNATDFGQKKASAVASSANASLPIFGASFFNNPKINLQPQVNIATPQDYQLGPADELYIELWGAATQSIKVEIRRDGVISIPGVAPIYLSGLTVRNAKNKIKRSLRRIYAGLYSEIEAEKVYLDVSLVKARSILVNIIGQAKTPGTYNLNGFASPLLAIYAAGGILPSGSFRKIQILRNGNLVHTFDIYDYLLEGKISSFQLRDQDVIQVPTVGKTVQITGAVTRPFRFELNDNEFLSELIHFAGGFLPNARKDLLVVESQTVKGIVVNEVDASAFEALPLNAGDKVQVRRLGTEIFNKVSIEGAVNSPGTFALDQNPTLQTLLASAGNMTKDAFVQGAKLFRQKNGKIENVIPVDLTDMEFLSSTLLVNEDRLVIPSFKSLNERPNISVTGEAQNIGNQTYYPGITLQDALVAANGFSATAAANGVEIFRLSLNQNSESQYLKLGEYSFSTDLEVLGENPSLNPRDVINIRRNPDIKPIRKIRIQGEVKNPGVYILEDLDDSAQDMIRFAGGLNSNANPDGIFIERTPKKMEEFEVSDSLLNVDRSATLKIPVLMDSAEATILKDGDTIEVGVFDPVVTIEGAVFNPTAINHRPGKSLRSYLNAAGGLQINAKDKYAYVVDANGTTRGVKKFLFFKVFPRVSPGSTIIVPEIKESRRKMTTQEWIGITSGISTLGILINTLLNQ